MSTAAPRGAREARAVEALIVPVDLNLALEAAFNGLAKVRYFPET